MGPVKSSRRAKKKNESGHYGDGWAGPDFRMPLNMRKPARIYLEGVCPKRKEIRVSLDGKKKFEIIKAEADALFRYEREIGPGRHFLRIQSPSTKRSGDNRRLGFQIHATNLFLFR